MVKFVEESVEILDKIDGMEILKKIERAGRTCYKSEDLITNDSCMKFAEMILTRNHLSVIEHVSITVKFITGRGMTHELVRHRLASYSQESTRYCNYGKNKFGGEVTVIDQRNLIASTMLPKEHEKDGVKLVQVVDEFGEMSIKNFNDILEHASIGCEACEKVLHACSEWTESVEFSETKYLSMLKDGTRPEIARGVLPTDLKTEIVTTMNLREWRYVLGLRTAAVAHPNIRRLMKILHAQFKQKIPVLFDKV